MYTLQFLLPTLTLATLSTPITRYTTLLSENAVILASEYALKVFTTKNSDVTIHDYNGGYAIRQGWDGGIIAYTADPLSMDLDVRMASARLFDRLLQEKGMSEIRLGGIFKGLRACSHPRIAGIPGQLGSVCSIRGVIGVGESSVYLA
ncbi:hypothetical protein BJX96DRAFT_180683 [Aspergillus floccosus]